MTGNSARAQQVEGRARRTMAQAVGVFARASARADELGWMRPAFSPEDLLGHLAGLDTRALYNYMQSHGTALCVRWDEAAERWRCSWVVGLCHYEGVSQHPRVAIVAAASQALPKEAA